jgi:predicted glycoside hydrolase/deacetylase ChbG (UPF0249 family)
MPARLIINADDFGLTPGINRAVLELHQAGVISSATLMATGPAFEEAAEIARSNPNLGVGCHIVLVDGIPLSHPQSIPTLLGADGKTFRPSLLDFTQAALRGTIDPSDVAIETQAQIQALQRAGIDVTHVDSHKHTHLLPAIAAPLLHTAERCGVRAFRYPFEPHWSCKVSGIHTPWHRRIIQNAMHRFEPDFRDLIDFNTDEKTTSGALGIAATGTLDAHILRLILGALAVYGGDRVYELCCHPGYNDSALDAQRTRLRETRDLEREALRAVIPEILQQSDGPELIQLVHFGNLGVPGLQRASGQFLPNDGFEKVL